MSTLAVVEEILRETSVPMSVRQIVEHAAGRLPTRSKTPDTVVARDLSMDIKKNGEKSLFIRTAPGRYTLREIHQAHLTQSAGQEAAGQAPGTFGDSSGGDGSGHTTSMLASAMRAERAGTLPATASSARPDASEMSGAANVAPVAKQTLH